MPKRPEKSELPAVLRTRHQWLRWRGVLIVGILGLAATLAALWLVRGSWLASQYLPWLAELWISGLVVTLLAILIAYFSASRSLLSTAQKLDGQFAAKGRLEAVALLKDSTSPLAKAQREETVLYLTRQAHARPVRGLPWLTTCLVFLVLAHLLTLMLWFMPTSPALAPWTAWTKSLAPHPSTPPDMSKPAIAWHTPDPVTQANPLEQVPAEASVQTTTPLQNLTLQISVNGELKKSLPIPSDQYAQPGEHDIKVTIPLDALQVKPFDVVSYKLTAQNSASEKAPETTSATQFVQVRPFRNPATPTGTPAAATASNASQLLDQLQQAQLQALSDNMNLARSDSSPTDPTRQKEDASVAADQIALAAKTEEVAKALGDEHAPADTLDHLRQAEPLMDDSGKKILAAQNEEATASQQKAVSLIADAEKSLQPANEAVAQPAPPAGSDPTNPFNDQQKHDLSPRQKSLIAQLETLAKNQTALAEDIGKNLDDSTSKPQVDPSTMLPPPAPPVPIPDQPAPNTNPAAPPNATQPAANATTPPAPASATQPPANANTPAATPNNPAPPAGAAPAAPNVTPAPAPAPPPIDPFGPDANKGNFAERQDHVLKGIAVLQNADKSDLETGNQPLASAQKEATDSLRQLSAEQENAAREPAATAALDLQQTVNAMNQAGEAQTRQTLAETQQKLNDLASQLRGLAQNHPANASQALMATATEVHDMQQGLQSAADHQENEGSATGANQLNQLAQNLQDQKSASELVAMSKSGLDPGRASAQADNLENLARQAAADMTPARPSAQDFAGLADALERTETNLAHLAQQAGEASSLSSDSNGAPGSQPDQQASAQPNGQNAAGHTPGQNPSTVGSQSGSQPSGQNVSGSSPSQNAPGSTPPPDQQPAASSGTGKPANQGKPTSQPDAAALSQAYHEAFQNLKSQTQQMAKVVPGADVAAVQDVIIRYDKDTSYRTVTPKDVVRFHADLQQPLEKAIVDVQGLQQHAQRDEVVNTPDLDETPAAYRPAVSQYFQDVSRDYHSSPSPNSKP